MSERFFLDPSVSKWNDKEVVLGGDEAYHFIRVMRGKAGSEIILFEGNGLSYKSRVNEIHKDRVFVQIIETIPDTIESPLSLTVATALPKGDRQRFLVEKLAELGTARFVPLRLERSVARSNATANERMKRYVIESAKQCGRNVLMEITKEMSLVEMILFLNEETKKTTINENEMLRFLLHPVALGEVGQTTLRKILAAELPKQMIVLAGPEGSFTEEEVTTALESGFHPLDLGSRILRTETACVAAAAAFLTFAG